MMNKLKLKTGQRKDLTKKIKLNNNLVEVDPDELKEWERKTKADKIKSLLENVCSKIDGLDYDNFDILFPEFLSNMKEATILREELINEVGSEELMEKRPELFLTPKQIEKKYDNIVEKFFEEERRLEQELNTLNQMKKLTAYQR